MMMQGIAGGTILPARFVIASTVADNTYLAAGAGGGPIVGISQKGTRRTPYGGLDDGNAALVGENLGVFGPNETAPLEYGGTVTVGARLKSDSVGRGIMTTADGDEYGAIAYQAGTVGTLAEVLVEIGMRGA